MPTIRQYFKKSIKYVFLIFISIIFLFSLCYFVAWFFPSQAYNGFVVYALSYFKEIFLIFVLFFCCFIFFRFYAVLKKTNLSIRKELRNILPVAIFWVVLLFLVFFFLFNSDGDHDCGKYDYTQRLNGGVKEFDGKKYLVSICGSGLSDSLLFGDSMESVQLSISNEQGSVLARRHYKVFWGGKPGHEPLRVDGNQVVYQDDENQQEYAVSMPPTILDWILARF